ncbi:MAG: type II toxin-antitoxin system RelE family toxin [Bradyrhizobium sp.]
MDGVLAEISENPLAIDVRFLRGTDGLLQCRIGDWRIIFEIATARIIRVRRSSEPTHGSSHVTTASYPGAGVYDRSRIN